MVTNSLNRWHKCASNKGLTNLLKLFGGSLSGRDIMVMEFYDVQSRNLVYLRLAIDCGLMEYAMLCLELIDTHEVNVASDFRDRTITRLQMQFSDGLFELRNGDDVIKSSTMKWRFLSIND